MNNGGVSGVRTTEREWIILRHYRKAGLSVLFRSEKTNTRNGSLCKIPSYSNITIPHAVINLHGPQISCPQGGL